jgi:hypothetical protein
MDGESWPAPIGLPENARANRLMLHVHRWEVCAQGGVVLTPSGSVHTRNS